MAFNPLDVFTGGSLDQAAQNIQNAFGAATNRVGNITGAAQAGGFNALTSGQAGALAALSSGYGTARSDILGMLDPATRALYAGQTAGAGALTGGRDAALAALQSGVSGANAAYDPLAGAAGQYGSFGTPSAQMIADANGLNGPEGVARAQAAFRASPGYDYQREQAIQGAVRGANIGGGALSGNTLDAVTRLSSNLADQDYGSWLQRLQAQAQLYSPLEASAYGTVGTGRANAALTGGTGAANINTGVGTGLAGLFSGTGANLANIFTGAGTNLANLGTGAGVNAANVYQGTGKSIADLLSNLSGQNVGFQQAQLAPTATAFENAGLGEFLGSKNFLDFLGQGATAGTKVAGHLAGGGTLF